MPKNYGNDSQIAEIVKYISDTMKFPIMGAGGGFAPIGTINSYMGTTAPIGWLACDGTVYNISDYPDLATHIASHFGSTNFFGGNGTTTFGVPDLRGEFLRGTGTNSHTNQGSGANVGVHQDATEHINICIGTGSGNLFFDKSTTIEGSQNADTSFDVDSDYNVSVPSSRTTTDFDTVYTSRPTNTSVLFIIKATVSDAEINAFNVYTPREHQVAWWEEEIDGVWKRKPVYEKRYDGLDLTIPANTWDESFLNVAELSIDFLTNISFFNITNDGISIKIYPQRAQYQSDGYLHVKGNATASQTNKILLRYTKSTDEWQTS